MKRSVSAVHISIDRKPLYQGIRPVAHGAGCPATDLKLLLAQWPFAGGEGVGSAQALPRLYLTISPTRGSAAASR